MEKEPKNPRELLVDMTDLVWENFAAKDIDGRSGDDRNKTQTALVWAKFHEIGDELKRYDDKIAKETRRYRIFSIVFFVACMAFLYFQTLGA